MDVKTTFVNGLKQSLRSWYFRFHEAITSFGLSMVSKNHCVYVKRTIKRIMFLALYVDDIILARNNLEMINAIKQWLSSVFDIKDIGGARYALGMEMVRNSPKRLLDMC